jgi:hypothetical protein
VGYKVSENTTKICIKCGEEKEENLENFSFRKDTNKFKNDCKVCVAKKSLEWYNDNKEKSSEYGKQYYKEHKNQVDETHRLYYENNKEKKKEYYLENKEEITEYQIKYREEHKEEIAEKAKVFRKENRKKLTKNHNKYSANRRKNDPIWKCMKNISSSIFRMLKSQGGSKNGISCKLKLPYTEIELWEHLIRLFDHPDSLGPNGEVWMTKNNQGVYNIDTWDEKDPATWKWQIDHIEPQADLLFDSYDHPNFLKCWSLKNLRPYSAKRNVEEGNQELIHKTKRNRNNKKKEVGK